MNKKRVKQIAIGVKIILTVSFIYFVNSAVSFEEFNWSSLFTIKTLTIALAGALISLIFQIERWYLLLKHFNCQFNRKDATVSFLEGSMLAFITPGRAGELLRGYTLNYVSKKEGATAVLIERAIAVAIPFTISLLLLSSLNIKADKFNWLQIYQKGITASGVLSILLLIFLPQIIKFFSHKKATSLSIKLILLSLVNFFTLIIQTSLLLNQFIGVSVKNGLIVAAQSYSAVQFMPVTVANMGVREFYYSLFSKLVSPSLATITQEGVLSVSILIVIFNIILPALPGLSFLLLYHIKSNRN